MTDHLDRKYTWKIRTWSLAKRSRWLQQGFIIPAINHSLSIKSSDKFFHGIFHVSVFFCVWFLVFMFICFLLAFSFIFRHRVPSTYIWTESINKKLITELWLTFIFINNQVYFSNQKKQNSTCCNGKGTSHMVICYTASSHLKDI